MNEQQSPLNAIIAFARVMEQLGIPYFIGGSFASSALGEFRTTNDIDFICMINETSLECMIAALTPDFICDEVAIRNAVKEKRSFNIIHEESFLKIDVFTRPDVFVRQQFRRIKQIHLPASDLPLNLSSAEDIILAKLRWYKEGGEVSSQQWRDVRGVMIVQKANLDVSYLREWANNLGISELLEKALSGADL